MSMKAFGLSAASHNFVVGVWVKSFVSCIHHTQGDAKKAVANALRNRWRRRKLTSPMKV